MPEPCCQLHESEEHRNDITYIYYTIYFSMYNTCYTALCYIEKLLIYKAAPQTLGNARNKLAHVASSAFLWIYIQNMLQWHDHSMIHLRRPLSFHSWNEQYFTENPCYSRYGPIPYFLNNTHTSFWRLNINFLRRDFLKINQHLKANFKKFIWHMQHFKNMIWVYYSSSPANGLWMLFNLCWST